MISNGGGWMNTTARSRRAVTVTSCVVPSFETGEDEHPPPLRLFFINLRIDIYKYIRYI